MTGQCAKGSIEQTSYLTLARNLKQFRELNGLLLEEGLLRKRVAEYGSSDELAEDMWFRRAVVHKRRSNKFDSQKERSNATSSYVSISIFCINYRIHSICRLKIDRFDCKKIL